MENAQTQPFIVRIAKYLGWAELIFLVALVVGLLLSLLKMNVGAVMEMALVGLAVTYLLSAYKPSELVYRGDEKFTFQDLLALTIVPKVLWISSAVSAVALLFFVSDDGTRRYEMAALIGGLSIAVAVAIIAWVASSGKGKRVAVIYPVLYRAIPLMLADFYILIGQTPSTP